jgi:predicted  nucleic acid-binding Zn-ribbon protein
MQVAETFKSANFADLQIAPSALYALAAPSTPESAREEALQQARNGQPVSNKEARETIARHKDPQPEQPPAALDDDELGSLLAELSPSQADIDSLLADMPNPDDILAELADETADEPQRREPPAPGYMRVRIVTGSYEDAQQAKDLLLQTLGSGKYTEPREASQPKYADSYRVYSREDVQIARAAQPVDEQPQQPAHTATPMEIASLRGQIEALQGENERLQAERETLFQNGERVTSELARARAELRAAKQEVDNLHRANAEEMKQATETIARLDNELQTARAMPGEARAILEEYRQAVSKAQQYKPSSTRGEAVSPLLRCIERVWLLLQEKAR